MAVTLYKIDALNIYRVLNSSKSGIYEILYRKIIVIITGRKKLKLVAVS